MNKTKVLTVLLAFVLVPASVFADFREYLHRIEFGPAVGVGFYVGQKNPAPATHPSLVRVQLYDILAFEDRATLGWPGIETFGFSVGYRFNTRWQLAAKTTRQRLAFAEYDESVNARGLYYNAMWHVDVMAEYNILNYGNRMVPEIGMYNVVPYVGFGLGVTMFNENATLRAVNSGMCNERDINTWQPQVGKMYVGGENDPIKNEIGVGLFIPVAFGVKWRISDIFQLKGAFQYQLYFSNKVSGKGLNSNLEGATTAPYFSSNDPGSSEIIENMHARPTFDELSKRVVGFNHDCLFSLTAIFSLEKWYEDRLVD